MQGGIIERQAVDGGPQIEGVATNAASGVKALKGILPQMDGERWLGVAGLAVERAATAALLATPTHAVENAEVLQQLLQSNLLTQKGKVHYGACARTCGRQ